MLTTARADDPPEDWVLQRLEYVLMGWRFNSAGVRELQIISEGNIAADGNMQVAATNSLLPPGEYNWSEVLWSFAGAAAWSFPVSVPYVSPDPPVPDPLNSFNVNVSATFQDPRKVPIGDPTPFSILFETRVSSIGIVWGPGPPTPPPGVNPVIYPNWRKLIYWNWGGIGPWPPKDRDYASTTGDASVFLSSAMSDVIVNAYGTVHKTVVVEFYAHHGASEGDSASYRVLYLYPRYERAALPIRVDTLSDVDDGIYTAGQQSLREALKRAGQSATGIDIPILVSGTIILGSQLTVPGTNNSLITVLALAGDVTLDGHNGLRILEVSAGKNLLFAGVGFKDGHTLQTGGAILNHGQLELQSCDLVGNSSEESGGAILNEGQLKLRDCLLDGNDCKSSGGAIHNLGNLEVESCWFEGHRTDDEGGAIYSGGSATTLVRGCNFIRNSSENDQGSTLCVGAGGSLHVLNSVIMGSLGAVKVQGDCKIEHSTIYAGYNLVMAHGDGVVELSHCLLDSNFDYLSRDLRTFDGGTITSLGYNAIRWPSDATFTPAVTDIMETPLYVSHSSDRSLVLMAYSPCVNTGNPAFNPNAFNPPLGNDVRGRTRLVDSVIDIGAMEVSEQVILNLLAVNGANGDKNNNGIPDIVDVLSGVNPTLDLTSDPPVTIQTAAGGATASAIGKASATDLLPGGTTVLESRIDERVIEAKATLQTSTDLINWTDRATYTPLGKGLGYARTLPVGVTLVEDEKSGYCWFIREQMNAPPGGRLFVRMKATQLP